MPAFKIGDKHDKSNYQTSSILPLISKAQGKSLYKQIESSYVVKIYFLIFIAAPEKILSRISVL